MRLLFMSGQICGEITSTNKINFKTGLQILNISRLFYWGLMLTLLYQKASFALSFMIGSSPQ